MAGVVGRVAALLPARTSSLSLARSKWTRLVRQTIYPSLEDRLNEVDPVKQEPELHAEVDIGLGEGRAPRRDQLGQRLDHVRRLRQDRALEKAARDNKLLVDVEEVEEEWSRAAGPFHLAALARHYGIYKDLFGPYAYFIPRVPLEVTYPFDQDTESVVYRGNVLKPKEVSSQPVVKFESGEDELWTLVLTSPDNNLHDNDKECLHWMVGNIRGGVVESGEVLCDYLQPFPPRGTGYHRYVFTLYKQHKQLDFSGYKREQPCLRLAERTFSTLEFYRGLEDDLTPAGLAWFQSDWDQSLSHLFHHVLKMREPVYEYDFPEVYLAPQKYFPLRKEFNLYMDLHRDRKQVNKEILLKRLQTLNPLEREVPKYKYPGALPLDQHLPSWQKKDIKKERLGKGKYHELYKIHPRDVV